MSVAALVVGAGSGERLRASLARSEPLPKAFVPLAGKPLIVHAAEALAACDAVACVVPVVPPGATARADALVAEGVGAGKLAPAVEGGAERQDSVQRGLESLADRFTHVAIHDAARPLVRRQDVEAVVSAGREYGAALLAVPVTDTLKRVGGGIVRETPSRAEFWAAQTPQVFRIDWLREALAKARAEGFVGTDDAAVVERLGVEVRIVAGDPGNWKITTADDLVRAEAVLARREGRSRA